MVFFTIFRNAPSNTSGSSSVSCPRANSRNRSYCALSSILRLGGLFAAFRVVFTFVVVAIERKPQLHRLPIYGASSQNGLGGFGLGGGLATSRSVSQPLADDAADRTLGPLYIVNTESDSVAVAEIEFCQIAVKVFFADVLIDAIDPALQDGEVIFGGIGGSIAANVFVLRVVHGPVTGESLSGFPVDTALVSAQMRSNVDFGFQDRPQVCRIDFRNVARADTSIAFNERDYGFLGRRSL
jgi:hypothetical protein